MKLGQVTVASACGHESRLTVADYNRYHNLPLRGLLECPLGTAAVIMVERVLSHVSAGGDSIRDAGAGRGVIDGFVREYYADVEEVTA